MITLLALSLIVGFLWWFKPSTHIRLRSTNYTTLPGWSHANASKSFHAFQASCRVFLRRSPESDVGSQFIKLKAKDWYPACTEAMSGRYQTIEEQRRFFEDWFVPVAFHKKRPVQGLFTGYYLPSLEGSLKKTEQYRVPLYGKPKDLVTVKLSQFDGDLQHHKHLFGRVKGHQLVPYYSRKEIGEGAIASKAPVRAWVQSEVERQFLEIEGSGVIRLNNGETLFVGYEGENGLPYRALAGVLIEQGVMTKDNASMQRIKAYFQAHPEQVRKVLNKNKSFVFFRKLKQEAALGAQGLALTPGYSLAVDRQWIPLGTPIWLDTNRPPKATERTEKRLQRLMIAQDTGGAIRGPVRGDVFWGAGETATHIAGHMKHMGQYWLFLPKHIVQQRQL